MLGLEFRFHLLGLRKGEGGDRKVARLLHIVQLRLHFRIVCFSNTDDNSGAAAIDLQHATKIHKTEKLDRHANQFNSKGVLLICNKKRMHRVQCHLTLFPRYLFSIRLVSECFTLLFLGTDLS